jgi:hypothetical protein
MKKCAFVILLRNVLYGNVSDFLGSRRRSDTDDAFSVLLYVETRINCKRYF